MAILKKTFLIRTPPATASIYANNFIKKNKIQYKKSINQQVVA